MTGSYSHRDARHAAFHVLCRYPPAAGSPFMDDILATVRVPPAEQGLLRELVSGSLRFYRLYDALSRQWLKAKPPAPLLVALRVVCHQLFALDRIPPHAACDTMVGLMRGKAQRWRGVVNAVARKLAGLRRDQRAQITWQDQTMPFPGPLGRLDRDHWPHNEAIRYSIPDQLAADLQPHMPPESWPWLNIIPPLTTRQRQGDAPAHADQLRRDGAWVWWSRPATALRGPVANGQAVVQDYSQGLSVALLQPQAGEWVWDCCAAPGGKSQALIDAGCRVVSSDSSQQRMSSYPGPYAIMDATKPAIADHFDAVVCDVPCSNSGVLARRPEAAWRYDSQHVQELIALQQKIVQAAASRVAPHGRLLYATCSLIPAENAAIVAGLQGWRVDQAVTHWPGPWHAGGFAALLRRC